MLRARRPSLTWSFLRLPACVPAEGGVLVRHRLRGGARPEEGHQACGLDDQRVGTRESGGPAPL